MYRILYEKGIKPSYARIKIYSYLQLNRMHPTVDEIYNALVNEIPTLSKTTVYNTLKLFESAGITRAITIEDNEARYDINVDNHGHFKCKQCGKIYDFSINMEKMELEGLNNFIITEKNVYFKGVCAECRENNK
jgi:Fe2+ or Zn2+ uptake regulation protein